MSDRPRIIWLYHPYLANLLSSAAKMLREDYGITTTLVCYNRATLPVPGRHHFDPDDFEEVFEFDPHLRVDTSLGDADLAAWSDRAAEIERRYRISLMEAIRADRLVGIDYVVGAWFPRSRYGRNLNHVRALSVAVNAATAVADLLDRTRPIAMVGASSALAPSLLWRTAIAKGIPVRNLVVARSGEALYWTDDDYMSPIGISAAFDRCMANAADEFTEVGHSGDDWLPTPVRAQIAIQESKSEAGLTSLARQIYGAVRKRLVLAIRGRNMVYGIYLLRDQLRLIFDRWRWRRRLKREPAAFTTLPEGTPFVYFPLQIEPESTLMFESPMCDNALTAIDWLVKTVPAGWLVVIKEHPAATAPRPRGFWQQLRRYPNLVVAGTLEDSEPIVRRAKAVAVLNSSLGIQAATIGKPVVTFHPGFVGTMLGHVQVANSYESTMLALRRVCDDELPPKARRVIEGRALRQALEECQFPASDPQILGGVATEQPIVAEDLDAIVTSLLACLPEPPKARAVNA